MNDKSPCAAAMLIKECRKHPELKACVLAGHHGLLQKHIVENERAWTEQELNGQGDGT